MKTRSRPAAASTARAPGKLSLSPAWLPIWPTMLASVPVAFGGGPLPNPPKVQPGAGSGGTTPGGLTTGVLDGGGLGVAAFDGEGTGVWRVNVNVPVLPFVSVPDPDIEVPSAEMTASLVATYEPPSWAATKCSWLPLSVPVSVYVLSLATPETSPLVKSSVVHTSVLGKSPMLAW